MAAQPSLGASTPMKGRIYRSTTVPVRQWEDWVPWETRWKGPDRGLILCWENGRTLRQRNPALAAQAEAGGLPGLMWKGGTDDVVMPTDIKNKVGALQYLATWQGLRGEDLDIHAEGKRVVVCPRTGIRVTFKAELPDEESDALPVVGEEEVKP